jgi:hypothetical protein
VQDKGGKMVELSFEINGRKVSRNNMKDALEVAVLENVSAQIKQKVGSIRCSEHHQSPKIKGKGRSLTNLSFEISGCCDDIMDKVKSKLK